MEQSSHSAGQENVEAEAIPNSERMPKMKQVGILYSIVVLLFIMLGARLQHWQFLSGILITEYIIVLLPPLIYLLKYKYDLKETLRLNKASFTTFLIVILIAVCAIPLVTALNFINLLIIEQIFGKIAVSQIPLEFEFSNLLLNIFLIGVTPAICEEILFRGTIQRGFERFGHAKAILITAFLFGLMHADFQKFLGTFLLGALIGFIVYRTNSIFTGMVAHFTNNSLIVLMTFVAMELGKFAESYNEGTVNEVSPDLSAVMHMPVVELIAGLIVFGTILLIFLTAFVFLIKALIKRTENRITAEPYGMASERRVNILWSLPGVAVIGFIYIAQGLILRGVNNTVLHEILRFIIGTK